jgi:predicted amidohydrolase
MKTNSVKIALIQMEMSDSQQENLARALELVSSAAKKGAQIACLPELFNARYFAQTEDRAAAEKFAESIPGKASEALSECARTNKIVLVAGSVFEKSGTKYYNTAMVFDESGKMLGKYRKTHIPQDECFYEQEYFEKGDSGFKVFDTKYGKIGVLICYDQWYPEAARINTLMGADIIFYPTAIGAVKGIAQAEGDWQKAWENVMRGHAIANGTFVCAANRCGAEGRMEFWGGSFVCDAFGATLKRAGNKEEIVLADADLSLCRNVREGWGFLRNRRPEAYSKITERV